MYTIGKMQWFLYLKKNAYKAYWYTFIITGGNNAKIRQALVQ